jgi:hypothetical protein
MLISLRVFNGPLISMRAIGIMYAAPTAAWAYVRGADRVGEPRTNQRPLLYDQWI